MSAPETFGSAIRLQTDLCTRAPVGQSVVALAVGLENPIADLSVQQGLDKVQRQLELLEVSTHPDDQDALRRMSGSFVEHDAPYLPNRLQRLMAGQKVVDWMLEAKRSDLLSLLQWNVERQALHQERLERDLPELCDQAIAGIDRVVNFGLLPDRARWLTRKVLSDTQFIALDSFERARRLCAGFYNVEDFVMGLACQYHGGSDGFEARLPSLGKTFIHETGHGLGAISGGGLDMITSRTVDCTWSDEARVEHWTQVALHGEPELIAPSLRTDKGGTYHQNRELDELVMNGGGEEIPQDLVGEAYLESCLDGDEHMWKARKEFDRRLRRSFKDIVDTGGDNIIEAVARQHGTASNAKGGDILGQWTKKISEATGILYEDVELPSALAEVFVLQTVA